LSEKSTPWSEIVSGISAFFALILTYLGIQPWNTLFAVVFGAAITYLVQKRLQGESEKRNVNLNYIETYYGPLLVEIQKIQYEVLSDMSGYYDFKKFDTFVKSPQFYTMGKKLRADFLTFSDEVEKLDKKISFYNNKIIDLIREKGNHYLTGPIDVKTIFIQDSSNPPIFLRYSNGPDKTGINLNNSILQDKNPIDIIKEKVKNFQEQCLQVELNLEKWKGELLFESGRDSKSYTERSMILNNIISEVQEELNRDKSYKDFKLELNNLKKMAENISSRLTKYINKYISIVDI